MRRSVFGDGPVLRIFLETYFFSFPVSTGVASFNSHAHEKSAECKTFLLVKEIQENYDYTQNPFLPVSSLSLISW